MLVKKLLNFAFIDIAHLLRRNYNLIAILVASRNRQLVDIFNIGVMKAVDPDFHQVFDVNRVPRIMRKTLVTLGLENMSTPLAADADGRRI